MLLFRLVNFWLLRELLGVEGDRDSSGAREVYCRRPDGHAVIREGDGLDVQVPKSDDSFPYSSVRETRAVDSHVGPTVDWSTCWRHASDLGFEVVAELRVAFAGLKATIDRDIDEVARNLPIWYLWVALLVEYAR